MCSEPQNDEINKKEILSIPIIAYSIILIVKLCTQLLKTTFKFSKVNSQNEKQTLHSNFKYIIRKGPGTKYNMVIAEK